MSEPFMVLGDDGYIEFSREFISAEPYIGPGAKPREYIILEEFYMKWQHENTVYRLRDPKGMITDFASVPWWAWSITGILPDGPHRNAAAFHDIGYMWQGNFPPGWFQKLVGTTWVDVGVTWSKDEIDRLFLRIMKAYNVDPTVREEMYYAVKFGGWPAWWQIDHTREKYRNAFA